MKSKVTIMLASLLILGACSTGTYVARTYDDDIYFSPGDIVSQPVLGYSENREQNRTQNDNAPAANDQQLVISQSETFQDGTKALNNYIFTDNGQDGNLQANLDALDNYDLVESDTTMIGDDDDYQYIINNYYQMDDLDYANRISRFHRPYFYGSFGWNNMYWDDMYYPYSSWNYGGWGYSPFYSGMYWNYPYSSWYSPYYYGGWGWPYSYGGYYGSYYSNNYWPNHGGGYYNSDDYHYGQRRASYSTVADGRSGSNYSTVLRNRDTNLKSGSANSTNYSSDRDGLTSRRDRSSSGNIQETKSATLTEKRRSMDTNSGIRDNSNYRNSNQTGFSNIQNNGGSSRNGSTIIRNNTPSTTSRTYQSGTTTQQRTYVPSYSKPRTVTRSTYNSNSYIRPNSSSTYSSPRVTTKSSSSKSQTQNDSGNVKNTYKSNSSYSKGSSTSSGNSSRSSYSRSSSSNSSSYSPSRSSSGSGSYSSGNSGSYSGGSGGGSQSSGGSRSGSGSGRR